MSKLVTDGISCYAIFIFAIINRAVMIGILYFGCSNSVDIGRWHRAQALQNYSLPSLHTGHGLGFSFSIARKSLMTSARYQPK